MPASAKHVRGRDAKIIVGVDAGTTRAIAAVDFNGRPVAVKSAKNWPEDDFVQSIAQYSPVIIACDTNPSHKLANRLKAAFGARLYAPKRSLRQTDKLHMTAGFPCRNAHERDALAAALKAYHSIENKLRQTAKMAGKEKAGAAQRMVLGGAKMRHAIARL